MAIDFGLAVSGAPECLVDILCGDLIIFFSIYLLECQPSVELLISRQLALQEFDLSNHQLYLFLKHYHEGQ